MPDVIPGRFALAVVVSLAVFSRLGALAAAPDNSVYGGAPLTVQFNAAQTGLDGNLSYRWDFGDGTTSAQGAPLHTYTTTGTYTARVTTTSDTGAAATNTVTIYVDGQAPPTFPLGDVNQDCKVNILDLIAIRNNLNKSDKDNPCDLNNDGKVNIIDLIVARNSLGKTCDTADDTVPPLSSPPSPVTQDWSFVTMWEKGGITTPKSSGYFARRAQIWDLGETIPFTFKGSVNAPADAQLNWSCSVRNYWGELLTTRTGTATVGADGTVQATANWTANYLGINKVTFNCGSAEAAMIFAVIKPIGDLWNSTGNPFGGMGQHPGYDEFAPYLDQQKRIGMKTLRIPITTDTVAPGPGQINFPGLDSQLDAALQRGFICFPLLTYFPAWMNGNAAYDTPAERIDWFAWYVGQVVSHCKTKGITHYEIWNEPNLGHFWPYGNTNYCEMLKKCYAAAKAADPNCVIISGGMPSLPGAAYGGIGSMLIDGAYRNCYDIFGGHYYRTWGGYSPESSRNNMFAGFKSVVARARLAGKPTWDTESDYGFFYQSENESMNWYMREMVYMLAAGVDHITIYAFGEVKEKLGYTSTWWHNFFAMITNRTIPSFTYDNWPSSGAYRSSSDCFVYTPLPQYPAYSAMVHELVGAKNWTQATLPDGNLAFVYQINNSVRAVCWRGGEERFSFADEFVQGMRVTPEPVAIRDIFGNPVPSSIIPLGPSLVYVDFGTEHTTAEIKTALENGELLPTPGQQTGSFNIDYLNRKLYNKTAGLPQSWYVLTPISDPALTVYNNILPAQLAVTTNGGVRINGADYQWQARAASVEANSSKIDIKAMFPDANNDNKTVILYATFDSPTARRGRIHYGASGNVQIWVNGRLLADRPPAEPMQPNRYTAPGHPEGLGIDWGIKPGLFDIKEGRNVVMIKLHGTVGDFGTYFRVAWENFDTMNDLRWLPE